MKVSLLKILRGKEGTNKPATRNRKIISFAVCFLIAFTLWLMNTLSKKYTDTMAFGIEYLHFPQPQKSFSSTDTIKIKVNSTGFRIVAYTFGFMDKTIKLDAEQFKHKENMYLYTLNNHIHASKIEEQLGEEVKLLDITPDTVFIRPKSL